MRILLVTGKGGVGKTTMAATTAVASAAEGARTLVVSTDAAHSLADVLDCPLGPDPSPVAPRLDAFQLDGRCELERSWSTIAQYLRRVLGVTSVDELEADELIVLPGLDQVLALARLGRLIEQSAWDVIVVDCAPSADSLRLLSLPDIVGWYMDRIFGRKRTLNPWIRRRVERSLSIPSPSDDVIRSAYDLGDDLRKIRAMLDGAVTSARIVVTPEHVVVLEAQRTMAYLALYGYATDAVLVNRVLGPELIGTPLESWVVRQAEQLVEIDAAFASLPRLRVHLQPFEPVGAAALGDLANEVYGARSPLDRFTDSTPLEFVAGPGGARVRMPVGGVDRSDIEVERLGDDLVVRLGPHRRTIALPDALRGRPVAGAGVTGNTLEVAFEGVRHG